MGLWTTLGDIGSLGGNRARRKEGQRDRKFQERMSSTSWSRGVVDMEAAGLNPALAYQQGGASSPSGAMAQQEGAGAGISSAMGVKLALEQVKQIKANADAARAQARKTDKEADWQEANNAAWGYKMVNGRMVFDMSMPNLFTKVQQELATGAAQMNIANMSLTGARNVERVGKTPYGGMGAAWIQALRGMPGPNVNLSASYQRPRGGR